MTGRSGSVLFLHAHPDDEAIFTGGTMALLARAGWHVSLAVATGGEWGQSPKSWVTPGPPGPGFGHGDLAALRRTETLRAADVLGIARVEFLGYHDSGLSGDPMHRCPDSLSWMDVGEVAGRVSALLAEEPVSALVTYDERGIYGHPDHVMVHRIGVAAAAAAGIDTVYECTVDREYLHFVETHVVEEARRATGELGLAGSHLGVATVEVSTAVDVRAALAAKRAALAAHASQIPETSAVLNLPDEAFSAVYGFEWFVRRGPPGPIEALA